MSFDPQTVSSAFRTYLYQLSCLQNVPHDDDLSVAPAASGNRLHDEIQDLAMEPFSDRTNRITGRAVLTLRTDVSANQSTGSTLIGQIAAALSGTFTTQGILFCTDSAIQSAAVRRGIHFHRVLQIRFTAWNANA